MRLEHHLVGGYVRYISPHIIIIIIIIVRAVRVILFSRTNVGNFYEILIFKN